MQVLSLAELKVGGRFSAPLFTADGSLVLLAWQEVDAILRRALEAAGVERLYLCPEPEEARALSKRAVREEVDVRDIKPGDRLPSALYAEDGRLLLAEGQRVKENHLALLDRRGIKKVYRKLDEGRRRIARFQRLVAEYTVREVVASEDERHLRVKPIKGDVAASWYRILPHERPPETVGEYQDRHARHLDAIYRLLQAVRVDNTIDVPQVHDLARDVVEDIVADYLYAINLASVALHNDYLADHSLSVAIFSVVLGALIGYPAEALLDSAIAGLLHDVGMCRVPPEVLEKPAPLSPQERATVMRHPDGGLQLMRDLVGLDRHIYFAVYQSHERYGGQGYPRGRKYPYIHDFARVLAVADTYQALVSPRPYRKRYLPYRALEEILALTREKVYDPAIVKVFVSALGLFPVGSWVRLNTGFVARVVDCASDDAARPIVSIVTDRHERRLDRPILLDLSTCRHTRITSAVDEEPYGFDYAAGFHSNGPLLPDLVHRDKDAERWVVPEHLMDWSASFTGSLSDFRLVDVIQLLDLAQKSGVLTVRTGGAEGRMYFSEGQMHKAEFGSHLNEQAVYEMVGLTEGAFSFNQRAVDVERAIQSSNTAVLLEAHRMRDETSRQV